MKRNVDLTSNGDFSRRRGGLLNLTTIFKSSYLKDTIYPWSPNYIPTSRENELFYTGNKVERRNKKEYESRDLYCCDCCGKLNTKKWAFKYCLCFDCHTALSERERVKKIWILTGYGSKAKENL